MEMMTRAQTAKEIRRLRRLTDKLDTQSVAVANDFVAAGNEIFTVFETTDSEYVMASDFGVNNPCLSFYIYPGNYDVLTKIWSDPNIEGRVPCPCFSEDKVCKHGDCKYNIKNKNFVETRINLLGLLQQSKDTKMQIDQLVSKLRIPRERQRV